MSAENNKRKQLFLKEHGLNIKIDGSWGPWQQKLYDRLMSSKNNNASIGPYILAPTATEYLTYLLANAGLGIGTAVRQFGTKAITGLGTLASPAALTVAGLLYSLPTGIGSTLKSLKEELARIRELVRADGTLALPDILIRAMHTEAPRDTSLLDSTQIAPPLPAPLPRSENNIKPEDTKKPEDNGDSNWNLNPFKGWGKFGKHLKRNAGRYLGLIGLGRVGYDVYRANVPESEKSKLSVYGQLQDAIRTKRNAILSAQYLRLMKDLNDGRVTPEEAIVRLEEIESGSTQQKSTDTAVSDTVIPTPRTALPTTTSNVDSINNLWYSNQ